MVAVGHCICNYVAGYIWVGVLLTTTADHLPEIVRGLVALIFLFDIYTVWQKIQIHRIRCHPFHREESFHLISENAADMIAIVNMKGRRLYDSLSYRRALGLFGRGTGGFSRSRASPSRRSQASR
jgi:hypothetical protein